MSLHVMTAWSSVSTTNHQKPNIADEPSIPCLFSYKCKPVLALPYRPNASSNAALHSTPVQWNLAYSKYPDTLAILISNRMHLVHPSYVPTLPENIPIPEKLHCLSCVYIIVHGSCCMFRSDSNSVYEVTAFVAFIHRKIKQHVI